MKGLSRLCNLTIWVHFQRKEVTHQTFFPVVRSTSRRICLNRKEPEWMKGLSRLCNLTIWANFQSKQRKQAIKRSSLLLVGRYPAARSWTKKTLFFCIHDVSSRDRGKEVLHVNAFVAMCHFHTYLPACLPTLADSQLTCTNSTYLLRRHYLSQQCINNSKHFAYKLIKYVISSKIK